MNLKTQILHLKNGVFGFFVLSGKFRLKIIFNHKALILSKLRVIFYNKLKLKLNLAFVFFPFFTNIKKQTTPKS
jgi:hypothetical protein